MEFEALRRFLLLEDHNTRVVVGGVVALGIAAGVLGTFLVLRRQALLTDTFGHATLPGIAAAFLLAPLWGGDPRQPGTLFFGAAASGLLAMATVAFLARFPGVRSDSAIAVVLSVFFGAGAVLLSLVQQSAAGNAAGISHYLYGKTATMVGQDLRWMTVAALLTTVFAVLLFKELRLWSFDPEFARSIGFPILWLDVAFAGLTAFVGVIALRAVGLVMLVALFVAPAATARCWSRRLPVVVTVAAVAGATAGWLGSMASALWPRMPTGALIVLVASASFLLSALLAPARRGREVRTAP